MSDEPYGPDKSSEVGIPARVLDVLRFELDGFQFDLQAWQQQQKPRTLNDPSWRLSRCKQSFKDVGRSDGVLIVEELQALLIAAANADEGEIGELVQLLRDATTALGDGLHRMSSQTELGSLMPMVSLLNDCRTGRGAEPLGAAIVEAVGIPSFEYRNACINVAIQPDHWQYFRDRVRANRADAQHAILNWFATGWRESADSSSTLFAVKQLRSALCCMASGQGTTIESSIWGELFAAALLVLDSIVTVRTNDRVAVRRLFAHLERCLAEVMVRDAHQPPLTLLQNLLWYIAESEEKSESLRALRERLQLDRLIGLEGGIQLQPGEAPCFRPDPARFPLHASSLLPVSAPSQDVDVQWRESVGELRLALRNALVPGRRVSGDLPDEAMLRSLQSLTLCLQAMDAREHLDSLATLQKLALLRHRQAQALDAREIREFSLFMQRLETTLGTHLAVSSENKTHEANSDADSLREVFDEEARHLVECMYQLLELESEMSAPLRVAAVLAHLHTLKGSARMAERQSIAAYAHDLEGEVQALDVDSQLIRLRKGRRQLQTLILNDQAERQVGASAPRTILPNGGGMGAGLDGVLEHGYDEMLRGTTVVGVSLARLGEHLQRLIDVTQDLESTALQWRRLMDESDRKRSTAESELLDDLEAAREQLSNELQCAGIEQRSGSRSSARMQQSLIRSRRVPAENFRERLQRVLDDADVSRESRLQLVVEGGQSMLDRGLYRQLLPVLEHLIRNARVHGIETVKERLALGKPATGEVRLSIQPDGVELIVSVCDDGRGVNSDAINAARAARGEAALESVAALQSELFRTGFTTLNDSSPLAGRGLGLSAVRQIIEQLGGRLGLWTRPQQGTRITLTVPQPIVIYSSLLVRAGARLYALPAERVKRIEPRDGGPGMAALGVEAERPLDLERLLGAGPLRQKRDDSVQGPFVRMNSMKRQSLPESSRRIHVESEGRRRVIEVTEILGHRELIAQPLGHQLASLMRFTGGSVLPDGQQVLMLDLERLLESDYRTATVETTNPRLRHRGASALVVDDSLTMRVAASRYLESRGLIVSTARDGIEALAMIGKRRPSLLIVDLDMPRLDGFGLLSRLQQELANKLPPTIVISSRNRPADRGRAVELGASEFLLKPWNNEQLNDALVSVGIRLPDLTIA